MRYSLIILIMLLNVCHGVTAAALNKPVEVSELQRFSLKQQMPNTKEHDIRMRKIIVKSGAKIAKHTHTDRAGIVYVISGEIIEYRNGKVKKLIAGDSIIEDFSTIHAYENNSAQDCVLIAFDIPKTETEKYLEKLITQ